MKLYSGVTLLHMIKQPVTEVTTIKGWSHLSRTITGVGGWVALLMFKIETKCNSKQNTWKDY